MRTILNHFFLLIGVAPASLVSAQNNPLPAQTQTIPLGNNQHIELIYIQPGQFRMGSPASDSLADEVEKPQKDRKIERGFYLGRTTVTFGQFQEFILDSEEYRTDAEKEVRPAWRGGHGYNSEKQKFEGLFPQYTWRNSGWPQSNDHPVGNVSWNDAMHFCQWLSKKTGKRFRLPAEAEWEYACRAGTTTIFFTGNEAVSLRGYANVPDEALRLNLRQAENMFPFNDEYPFTAPVGRFKANPWGLQDMLGNIFQWCADELTDGKRVLRGGSYNLSIQTTRCAYRGFSRPEGRYSYTGFRVVLEP
ncbi:Formylglycine-generating enzyme, required for sulfatase activity, contains SUMF1/FGE domain [Dyadobacter sp. SG02]|uniref:formylglycine-generating enzyme family protein n=1 Tax=Dyadobacter sp. SG02 TaxID=1855291 RepID=UPI0008BBB2CE|nr:formylglycine-generating enzyme family protein [Dyadobacter sp. SG02]SEI83572.1 Formylglycine-generating enzyme, required for sulfatase activity, contains SUMF1/FGE domain [Dyadobacter sp. SG02]